MRFSQAEVLQDLTDPCSDHMDASQRYDLWSITLDGGGICREVQNIAPDIALGYLDEYRSDAPGAFRFLTSHHPVEGDRHIAIEALKKLSFAFPMELADATNCELVWRLCSLTEMAIDGRLRDQADKLLESLDAVLLELKKHHKTETLAS